MDRELQLTEDGSHTMYVKGLDEPYHSIHGAIQESSHVFIKQGFHTLRKASLNILEIGLGTGLNVMLTLVESNKLGIKVHYHAVEKYPLIFSEYSKLNYERIIPDIPDGSLLWLHEASWGKEYKLTNSFSVYKEESDFRSMNPPGKFDLVYFDAFAPDKQPHLWTEEVFSKLSQLVNPGGILVSYTSKGIVRRTLISNGFDVTKVPGVGKKREMIRAIRR